MFGFRSHIFKTFSNYGLKLNYVTKYELLISHSLWYKTLSYKSFEMCEILTSVTFKVYLLQF